MAIHLRWDLIILLGPFQLRLFCDSVTAATNAEGITSCHPNLLIAPKSLLQITLERMLLSVCVTLL